MAPGQEANHPIRAHRRAFSAPLKAIAILSVCNSPQRKVLLNDFIFIGRVSSFDSLERPVIDVLHVIYGPTNITAITPDYDSWHYDLPILSTNIFFAMTNDWWNVVATTTNLDVIFSNRYDIYSWEVCTNLPADGATFTNWFVRSYGAERGGAIPLMDESDLASLDYVTNLVHMARIEKDKKKFLDFTLGVRSNCPPKLYDTARTFSYAINPAPRFVYLFRETFKGIIDYDRLYKGWSDDAERGTDKGNGKGKE